MKKIFFIYADGYYPYQNQAVETELIKYADYDSLIIYFWSNDKTVFIGKNQNAYSECNLDELKKDQGFLARRFTGGGAVYHDKGNLNFTFISHRSQYDKTQNFEIMLSALKSLGFDAQLSGRNDITIDGKKFSGNAFYKSNDVGLHHGTVLIKTDPQKLAKYLRVNQAKLSTKGVKSVVSRVVNLSEIKPDITSKDIADAILQSAKNKYPNAELIQIKPCELNQDNIKDLVEKYKNQQYLLGEDIVYDLNIQRRFEWGTADIRVKVDNDRIEKIKIYSDALDTELAARQEQNLLGKNIKDYDGEFADIVNTIKEKLAE